MTFEAKLVACIVGNESAELFRSLIVFDRGGNTPTSAQNRSEWFCAGLWVIVPGILGVV